jgi:NitT/TauT family transport system substrate-binding protein
MTDHFRIAGTSRRRFLQQAALLTSGGLLAACAPGGSSTAPVKPAAQSSASQPAQSAPSAAKPAGSVDKVRLVSWSQPRAEQASFYASDELGYFRDEGISYEYVAGQGSVLAAKTAQNVRTPADLRGKTIGVLSLASGGRYNVLTVLAANGMKEQDVTLVATGTNPAPFLEDKIDVWSTIIPTLDIVTERENLDTTRIYVRDYVNLPTDVLAVTEEMLRTKPDVIRRFLKGLKLGTDYAMQNVDGAAELGIKYGLDTKDPKVAAQMIRVFNEASVSEGTRQHGLGWFDMDLIQRGADFYLQSGLVKNRIDVNRYFTNQFVSQL